MKRYFILAIFLLLSGGTVFAQSARLKAANRQFENYAYLNAIRLYEEYLRLDRKQDPAERKECLTKLAYSYRKMNDSRNAERVYETLVADYQDLESETYLYYAQALASNDKHRDSQKMYAKYGDMQTNDLRGKRFTVSYMDMSRFYQDSSSYKVEYLPINSRQADFSPMYFKNGLVFVSARNEGGAIKRVFGWNQTPFLDLYFSPDTSELHTRTNPTLREISQSAGLGGAVSTKEMAEASAREDQNLTKMEVFSRTLNTKYHEGPATFFKGEEKMVFTRNNYNKGKFRESADGVNKLKIYSSDLVKGSWTNVKELPFNSNEYSCGHPALSPDNKLMFFVSDMPGGFGGTDIYVVEYRNGEWGVPVNMGKEINTEGNEMFPYVDDMGNLYFSSDGHEGLGGLDIHFMAMKDGIPAGNVENLGAPVNSEKDDFGFICAKDRSSGYFSSNRKRGISDDNIYYFTRSCKQLQVIAYDATTKTPLEGVDIRTVRNGENKDLKVTGVNGAVKICLDANTEYEFRAIREGYSTNSVLFSTKSTAANLQTKVAIYLEKTQGQLLTGVVKSELTQAPIAGATVTLKNKKDNTTKSVVTGADGRYEFDVKPGVEHEVVATKDKFTTNEGNTIAKVKKGKSAPIMNTDLGMIGEGDVFRLDNIYYDLNQFFIRPDAARELDAKVIPYLKKYPKLRIEIRSHTDARAKDDYNMRLSSNRARAVVDYLVARGINHSRLVSKGYGETQLLNDCADGVDCAEDAHQQNRRTEFKVLAVR